MHFAGLNKNGTIKNTAWWHVEGELLMCFPFVTENVSVFDSFNQGLIDCGVLRNEKWRCFTIKYEDRPHMGGSVRSNQGEIKRHLFVLLTFNQRSLYCAM